MTSRTPDWSRTSRANRACALAPQHRERGQQPVATDPLVGDRECRAGHRAQSPGQVVGPAVVAADARVHAIGNRVAERDHGPGRSGRPHVETAEVVPGQGRNRERADPRLAGVVAGRRYPVDLLGVRVPGGHTGPAWQVDAHRQLLHGWHLHAHRIAEDLLAGGDPDRRAAAEAHRVDRARDHAGAEVRHRHRHAADLKRRPAEGVRQLKPDHVAADAGDDDVADRLIVEALQAERARRGILRAGTPAGYPVVPAAGNSGRAGRGADGHGGRQDQQGDRT